MSTPEEHGRTTEVESLLARVGAVAGALAGLAGFVYLVGGVVMWLRFKTAELPPDQGVAVMAKEQLFVIGLRLMIIPLVVTGALAVLLALCAEHQPTRVFVRRAWTVLGTTLALALVVWAFAVIGWPSWLAVMLEALVLTGVAALVLLLRDGLKPWPAATLVTVVALIVVVSLGIPAVRIEDPTARGWVVFGALIAVFLPLLVNGAPRRRGLPRWTWVVAAVLAGVGALLLWGFWAGVAVALGIVAVRGALSFVAPRWSWRPAFGAHRNWWLPAVLIVAVTLVVPWSFASASWPIALGLIVGVWWVWQHGMLPATTPSDQRHLVALFAVTAVLAAAIVSIGRQLDEPVQLLHATVTLKEEGATPVEGVYLNAGGDQVYVGDTGTGTIVGIPRGDVRHVAVGPPDDRAPSPSLISRAIPGDARFSVRPFEVWCDGIRYRWTEGSAVCRSQPEIFWKDTESEHIRDYQRLGLPFRVWCPPQALRPCSGFVILRSRRGYRFGPAGVPRPVVPEPVPFLVEPARPGEVCLTVTAGQFGLMRGEAREKPVGFDAVVARDREGETVYDHGDYWVQVGPKRVETRPLEASDCEPRMRIQKPKVKGTAVDVGVIAWPRGQAITPRQVAGTVRLSARGPGGAIRQLGTRELMPAATTGRARFRATLAPGTWTLRARYISAVGIAYPQVVHERPVKTSASA